MGTISNLDDYHATFMLSTMHLIHLILFLLLHSQFSMFNRRMQYTRVIQTIEGTKLFYLALLISKRLHKPIQIWFIYA